MFQIKADLHIDRARGLCGILCIALASLAPRSRTYVLLPSEQPETGVMQRWSDANADKEYRLQPFGGEFLAFEIHDGFTILTRLRVGNLFGTPDYFPFFEAELTKVRFLHAGN